MDIPPTIERPASIFYARNIDTREGRNMKKVFLSFFLAVIAVAVLACAPDKPRVYVVLDHMTAKYGGAGKYGFKFYVLSPGCDIEKAKAIAKYEAYDKGQYLIWNEEEWILPNEMTFFIYTNKIDIGKRSADFIAEWSEKGDAITAR